MSKPTIRRQCTSCERKLPIEQFRSRSKSKGFRRKCRSCRSEKPSEAAQEVPLSVTPAASLSQAAESVVRNSQTSPIKVQDDSDSDFILEAESNPSKKPRTKQTPRPKPPPGSSPAGSLSKTRNVQSQRKDLNPTDVNRDENTSAAEPASDTKLPPCLKGGGSGASKKFRLPLDARNTRTEADHFPKVTEPLEPGFLAHCPSKPCDRCARLGIWCTYGDGLTQQGRARHEGEARCDNCSRLAVLCSLFKGNETRMREAKATIIATPDRVSKAIYSEGSIQERLIEVARLIEDSRQALVDLKWIEPDANDLGRRRRRKR